MAKHETISGRDALDSHRQFYADLPRPRDARECAEDGDAPEAVLRDELAVQFVGRGLAARTAGELAELTMKLFQARERELMGREWHVRAEEMVGGMNWLAAEDAGARLLQAITRAREARKSKLALGCWLFAMGRQPYGLASERDLAREQDVSPEAVSQEREAFQEILKLPRAPHQKSEAANEAYRGTNGAKTQSR